MKRIAYALCLACSLAGFSGLVGCEEEHHEREVKVDDNKVKTKDTTIRETPNSVQVEKQNTTKTYDDGQVKTKTETETKTYPK